MDHYFSLRVYPKLPDSMGAVIAQLGTQTPTKLQQVSRPKAS